MKLLLNNYIIGVNEQNAFHIVQLSGCPACKTLVHLTTLIKPEGLNTNVTNHQL